MEQADYTKALEYFFKALRLKEELGNKIETATTFINIGIVYLGQADYAKSLEYFFKALEINEEFGNKMKIATTLGNIGNVYINQKDYPKALAYYSRALKIFEELGNNNGIATILGNISIAYKEQGLYEKALDSYFASLKIKEFINDKNGIATILANIGSLYTQTNKYAEAEKYLLEALKLCKEIGVQDIERQAEKAISELYEKTGREKLALEHYKKAMALKDTLFSEESKKEMIRKEMNFQFEKKEAVAKAEHKKELEKQSVIAAEQSRREKIIRYSVIGGLIMMFMIAVIIFRSLHITRKQKKLIEKHKEIVELKHKEITDSINYAERIQRSFLATQEMLDKYLGVTSSSTEENTSHPVTSSSPKNEGVSRSERGYFVFFRPKDVVSGDFYWAAELNNGNFAFTCADSTGHGVPGAIMSILNISSLEKSVEKDTEPHQILNTTRRIIIDRLKKDGSPDGGKDGMDCSLLVLNKDKSQLSFASANNPVFILRAVTSSSPEENTSHPVTSSSPKNEGVSRSNNQYEILEYKPDKMPVGKHDK